MSFSVAYRDTGSVVGHYDTRTDAVRDAVAIAFDRPDLSFLIGVIEVGDDGMPVRSFASASDLLAANDSDAVAAAESCSDDSSDVEEIEMEITYPNVKVRQRGISKTEFVDRVAGDSGLSKRDAGMAVDSVIKSIESALGAGEDVNFTAFGKFHVAEGSAREGRDPRTGEWMSVSSSKVPRLTIARDVGRTTRPPKS